MKRFLLSLVVLVVLAVPLAATHAAEMEQFIPALIYRTGPYAAGGSGFFWRH